MGKEKKGKNKIKEGGDTEQNLKNHWKGKISWKKQQKNCDRR